MDTSTVLIPLWYEINPDVEERYNELITRSVIKRQTPPLGYTWDGVSNKCYPHPVVLPELVHLLNDTRYSDKRSIRESMEYINTLCVKHDLGEIKTAGGMSNVFSRLEKQLGLDKGETPSLSRVAAIRKARIEQRKLEGRKRPCYRTREDQKKIDAQKKLTVTNNELKKLKSKERTMKAKASRQAAKLKLKGDPTKYVPMEQDGVVEMVREAPSKIPKKGIPGDSSGIDLDRPIAFAPNPGPQTDFLSADEDIVLYGGAAGG